MSAVLPTRVLLEKLALDEKRERRKHLEMAISFRAVSRKFPNHARTCRELMRKHALLARGLGR